MALRDWTDDEAHMSSTLSDPDDLSVAKRIADSILAWSARCCIHSGSSCGTDVETP